MNENPPAFPNRGDNSPNNEIYDGMSLRDYFAGQVLSNSYPYTKLTGEQLAKEAYQIADLMLKERAKWQT